MTACHTHHYNCGVKKTHTHTHTHTHIQTVYLQELVQRVALNSGAGEGDFYNYENNQQDAAM